VRTSRLLGILTLLQLRVRLTADELAREFEVSVRTIHRDLEELSAAGVPICGDRGPDGGFHLADEPRTPLTGLAQGKPEPKAAERLSERFHLDPVDWYRAAEPVVHLPALARAVLDARVVSMTYDGWTGARQWRIEPLGLVLKAGAWYVVARGGEAVRIFKVANIREQRVEDECFTRPDTFDLPRCWNAQFSRFEARSRPYTATLRATALGLERLARLGAYAARAVETADGPNGDGRWKVILPIEGVDEAALALLGVGPEVEVFDPRALRDRVRELAHAVARSAD
jgi:predicted DNA-binding transcriptional regulator YafY